MKKIILSKLELETVAAVMRNSFHMLPAAKELYLHRNSLCSRIDRLRARTGLDLRICADALALLERLPNRDRNLILKRISKN